MAKLKDTEIKGNLSVEGNVTSDLTIDGYLSAPNMVKTGTITTSHGNLQNEPSFMGSILENGKYYNTISVRHKNGLEANAPYGMFIRSEMQRTDASLVWNQQDLGTWGADRTILDSANFKNYFKVQGGYNYNSQSSRTWQLEPLSNYLVAVNYVSGNRSTKHSLWLVSTSAGSEYSSIITMLLDGGVGTTLTIDGLTLTTTHSYIYNTVSIIKMNY